MLIPWFSKAGYHHVHQYGQDILTYDETFIAIITPQSYDTFSLEFTLQKEYFDQLSYGKSLPYCLSNDGRKFRFNCSSDRKKITTAELMLIYKMSAELKRIFGHIEIHNAAFLDCQGKCLRL